MIVKGKKIMNKRQQNIGIITPPIKNAGVSPLSNLVNIISSLSNSVWVITGNTNLRLVKKTNSDIHICKIQYSIGSNRFFTILKNIHLQFVISYKLIKYMKKSNILIYFLDSHAYILPVFIGRLLRKKIIFLLAASISGSTKSNDKFFTTVSIFSESMNFKLADYIIVYSPILVEKWNLQNYAYKILIAHEHFLCLDKFRVKINLNDRLSLFGYIGRLSGEKGVEKFVQALPAILGNQRKDFHVMIGGDGPLRSEIEKCLLEQSLVGQVEMTGWISHEDLPNYLNRMKLLVIPSYSEGLPNIMLEAMACGTPVLATPVGAIPDIIKDGETGFIMENNSPVCITENIIRALGDSNLENIAMNAKKLVEKEFTFESTVMQWKKIFDEI